MRQVSFEYFPPRGLKGAQTLARTIRSLSAMKPVYQTVTFGAAGSTIDGTRDAVLDLQRTGIPAASHVTAVGLPRAKLLEFADELWEKGVTRLVVLRGDLPEGLSAADVSGPDYVSTALELQRALLARHAFDVSVAAYPETHPKAASHEADLDVLRAKQDAGAARAITQFFFDNELFLRFRDSAAARGVTIPIVPGIITIPRFKSLLGFADTCGATVPSWLRERFAGADEEAHARAAARTVREQVEGLAREGVDDIHVYTLNRAELASVAARSFLSLDAHGERRAQTAA